MRYILQIIILLATAFNLSAQIETMQHCLHIKGKVMDGDQSLDHTRVYIYHGNDLYDSLLTSARGSFEYSFEPGQEYTLEVVRPGFFVRRVGISTKIPQGRKEVYQFQFEMNVYKQREGILPDYLDFPAALIEFNEKESAFLISRKYDRHIREMIKKELSAELEAQQR